MRKYKFLIDFLTLIKDSYLRTIFPNVMSLEVRNIEGSTLTKKKVDCDLIIFKHRDFNILAALFRFSLNNIITKPIALANILSNDS